MCHAVRWSASWPWLTICQMDPGQRPKPNHQILSNHLLQVRVRGDGAAHQQHHFRSNSHIPRRGRGRVLSIACDGCWSSCHLLVNDKSTKHISGVCPRCGLTKQSHWYPFHPTVEAAPRRTDAASSPWLKNEVAGRPESEPARHLARFARCEAKNSRQDQKSRRRPTSKPEEGS